MEKIKIRITEKGTIETSWWYPELGTIVCSSKVCPSRKNGKCGGWKSRNRKLDCLAGNPWCG